MQDINLDRDAKEIKQAYQNHKKSGQEPPHLLKVANRFVKGCEAFERQTIKKMSILVREIKRLEGN